MDDDLEPIDLEPIDLEPATDESRFERARVRRPGALWVAAVAVGLAAWGVVALAAQETHPRPSATPTSAPVTTIPSTFTPTTDRAAVVVPRLRAELQDVGVDRFAAVVDDHLYVLDESRSTEALVDLPEGHLTIDEQNGQLLLATTFQQTLVSTRPIATRTLSARDFAIPAWTPDRWWILNSDGTIRSYGGGPALHIPEGLRVAAAVENGFVALDVANSRWVLWAGATMQTIAPAADQLLVTGPETVVFKRNCGYSGCVVQIHDLVHGTTVTTGLRRVPNFAALSPDGTRLALASTQADVYIVDTGSGRAVVRTRSLDSQTPSLPFTWTPDSRSLLVVQNNDIQIRRATDGLLTRSLPRTSGLQQLIALP